MALNKENAAPDVTVGAATGQHLCNSEISISNEAQTGNENFAGSEAAPETNGINPTDISQSEAGKIISDKTSLQEVSMTELYDRVYVPKAPVVEGLLYPGTYIFAGSPKVGKSFFMAQLAYHVAAGIPLWDYPVRQGAVLYLALEDDYARLQKRLSRMFGVESSDSLYLVTESGTMANGLEAQLEQFIARHPDTALIIIDTLQRIREIGGEQYSYAKDYEMIKLLKAFADKHSICFLIVHHTRKMEAEDSFDMISGTNGLLGAADGAFVLKKKKRTDRTAALSIVGRDQQDQELKLEFDQERCFWKFVSAETELWKDPPDPVLEAVAKVISTGEENWQGTATELLEELRKIDPEISVAANALGRKLNVSAGRLFNEYGLRFESQKTHEARIIKLTKCMTKEQDKKKQE